MSFPDFSVSLGSAKYLVSLLKAIQLREGKGEMVRVGTVMGGLMFETMSKGKSLLCRVQLEHSCCRSLHVTRPTAFLADHGLLLGVLGVMGSGSQIDLQYEYGKLTVMVREPLTSGGGSSECVLHVTHVEDPSPPLENGQANAELTIVKGIFLAQSITSLEVDHPLTDTVVKVSVYSVPSNEDRIVLSLDVDTPAMGAGVSVSASSDVVRDVICEKSVSGEFRLQSFSAVKKLLAVSDQLRVKLQPGAIAILATVQGGALGMLRLSSVV